MREGGGGSQEVFMEGQGSVGLRKVSGIWTREHGC